jgi:hypothetical protein
MIMSAAQTIYDPPAIRHTSKLAGRNGVASRVASRRAESDCRLRRLSAGSGSLQYSIFMTASAPIVAAAMAPDTSWAVTVAGDGTVRTSDAGVESSVSRGLVRIGGQPVAVAMSSGRTLRVLWAAEETLWLYSTVRFGWSSDIVSRTSAPVRTVAFSPSGRVAVIACEDRTLRSLDVETGKFGWTLATGALTARAVAVASDRGPVAAVFADGSVRRYDPEAGTSDIVSTAPSVRLVTITPDGGVVVAANSDGSLFRWKPPLGAPPEFRDFGATITAVAVDGTGDKVLVGTDDGKVWRYDFADRRKVDFAEPWWQSSPGPAAQSFPGTAVRSVPAPAAQSSPGPAFEPPPRTGERRIVDEDVRFTVYRPQVMSPGVWASLLVFAHKTALVQEPGQAPVDPNQQVEAMARAHFGDAVTRPAAADARSGIFRGTRLRIVPDLPGLRCNPEDAELDWWEPVHEVLFRLRAEASLAGSVVRGAVRVWCGPLLLGEISVAISIAVSGSAAVTPTVIDSVQRYRKIFPSYSHDDRAVVEGFAEAARALGDQYLQDVLALRSGERWEARLPEFIRQADVFQLFWSSNSMRSRYCRDEWELALALGRPSFVRPLYWEDPLPEDPALGLPPVSLRELHFVKVRPYSTRTAPPTERKRTAPPTERNWWKAPRTRGDSDPAPPPWGPAIPPTDADRPRAGSRPGAGSRPSPGSPPSAGSPPTVRSWPSAGSPQSAYPSPTVGSSRPSAASPRPGQGAPPPGASGRGSRRAALVVAALVLVAIIVVVVLVVLHVL